MKNRFLLSFLGVLLILATLAIIPIHGQNDKYFDVFGPAEDDEAESGEASTKIEPEEVEVCTTKGNKHGTCVNVNLCKGLELPKKKKTIDPRSISDCSHYLDVCCSPENLTDAKKEEAPAGCGHRNPTGVGFTYTSNNTAENLAQFGELPWMVAIIKLENDQSTAKKMVVYQCGGSLIHPQAVLTAAHCVYEFAKIGAPKLTVRAGEWDTQHRQESPAHPLQDRLVKNIDMHKDLDLDYLYNDIALLTLEKPLELMAHIGVVCLPKVDNSQLYDDCIASGWGKNAFGRKGMYQLILKKVLLPTMTHQKCQKAMRRTRLGQDFDLHASFVCAGGEESVDMCEGDGGSPLVCPVSGKTNVYEQVGIVSWGIGCGTRGVPGAYASLSYLRTWIDGRLNHHKIDMTPYAA